MVDVSTVRELYDFLRTRKKLWLLPLVVVVLLVGVIAVVASSEAVAPLIYSLF